MRITKLLLALFAVTCCISVTAVLFSQSNNWDDPNLDRIPQHLLRQSQLFSTQSTNAVITSPDGYDNFNLGTDFAEPHMSVNPRNPLWFFNAFNTNSAHGTLNGMDWYNVVPNFGTTVQGDPVTAYDSLGNLYYESMTGNITGTRIVKSTDNGQNWLPSVAGNVGNDKNWIAADQTGGPYANYVYGTMTPGNFIRSTNQGASFSVSWSFSTQTLPGMMVCVGPKVGAPDVPGGAVYVVTNSGSSVNATYSFYVSNDGGASFSIKSQQNFVGYLGTYVGGRNSVQNMRTRPYPFITADNSYGPNRGRLYVIYATNNPAGDGNKSDVYCRYSTDQGATWSAPVMINDDPNPTANYQWHPSTWCDKLTGRLFVKWLDTRLCPTSDSCDVYASYSDNGGTTWVPNQRITTKNFRINCTSCGGGGTPMYLGDYDAVSAYGKNSMIVWTDFRAGTFGSYTAYYPDFAMTINPLSTAIGNNDSMFIRVKVPSVKSYTDRVKFTAAVDTLPVSGSFNFSFVNGKDSISTYPDSVTLRVKTIGTITPKLYRVIISGKGPNGTPVHNRVQNIYVGVAPVTIGTNREGVCDFKVNGVTYNTRQSLVLTIGSSVSVQAISPKVVGGTRYVYTNWSDAGDTTHNINITGANTYTAFYKPQYRLTIISQASNTYGGGIYYDSAAAFTFGVNARIVNYNGQTYQFRGWIGSGTGSYTSPDSTGNDTAITLAMNTAIVETARWQNITSVINISAEIPREYKLSQNYPNPFNPVTTINFDIVKAGIVRLVVYDALGRVVEEILNENVQPGSYKANFNAGKLASGMYFYKLTTQDFNDVKRMVVLK